MPNSNIGDQINAFSAAVPFMMNATLPKAPVPLPRRTQPVLKVTGAMHTPGTMADSPELDYLKSSGYNGGMNRVTAPSGAHGAELMGSVADIRGRANARRLSDEAYGTYEELEKRDDQDEADIRQLKQEAVKRDLTVPADSTKRIPLMGIELKEQQEEDRQAQLANQQGQQLEAELNAVDQGGGEAELLLMLQKDPRYLAADPKTREIIKADALAKLQRKRANVVRKYQYLQGGDIALE